ncbi:MAG: class I SAM-dependent methyltransferase [Kouleothrix sp.]|nr:class I SAM-dependent methyltransferase [Kouleothrix sp.]
MNHETDDRSAGRQHRHGWHEGSAGAPATRGRTIEWAWAYDALVNTLTLGRATALRTATADLAQVGPGDAVLDVGCGTGDLTLAIQRRVGPAGRVCGIDASAPMIEQARRKAVQRGAAVDFQVGYIERLAFPDASFDVVVSSLMWHHLPTDLQAEALAELRRVLRPGGRLLIVDFRHPTSLLGHVGLVMSGHGSSRVGVQDVRSQLAAHGFRDVEQGKIWLPLLGFTRGRAAA